MIRSDGLAKLTDFGIAEQMKCGSQLNDFIGTQMYMALERLNGELYDFKADIWSAGLVLVFCAMGRYPYDADEGFFGILQAVTDNPCPELDPDHFSEEFCDLISNW